MDAIRVTVIVIVLILVVAGVIVAFIGIKRSKEGKTEEPNYRAFYILGITFIPLGIVWIAVSLLTDISFVIGIPFLGLGVTYMLLGLANRDKWRK